MVLEWPTEYVLAKQMSTVGLVSGLELNHINANAALKVLYIEQLGLPIEFERSTALFGCVFCFFIDSYAK